MTTLRASMRPLRTELLGVAGVAALLLLAAGGVALRLLAFGLPAACFDSAATDVVCFGRQHDLEAYASFARDWGAVVALFAITLPPIGGGILGIGAIAKELEQRTAVLAWSVDSSRRHWLIQRTLPLLGVVVVMGLLSTQIVEAMLRLEHPEADVAAALGFEAIRYSGIGPIATGISALGIAFVIGAMLGRLLPTLLAVAALVVLVNVLVTEVNDRLMTNDSLVAEYSQIGAGRPIDTMLRTPDGRIITFDEAYLQYGDPQTGELPLDLTEMTRYVPIEIYPQVAARYALFHILIGLTAVTLAFAVVERRSPS